MLFYTASTLWASSYRKNPLIALTVVIGSFLNIGMWVLLFWKIKPLSYINEFGQVSLHYNIYFGIDKVGSWVYVLAIPIIGLVILLVNTLIGYVLYLKDSVTSYMLCISQLVLQAILTASAVLVILLNS